MRSAVPTAVTGDGSTRGMIRTRSETCLPSEQEGHRTGARDSEETRLQQGMRARPVVRGEVHPASLEREQQVAREHAAVGVEPLEVERPHGDVHEDGEAEPDAERGQRAQVYGEHLSKLRSHGPGDNRLRARQLASGREAGVGSGLQWHTRGSGLAIHAARARVRPRARAMSDLTPQPSHARPGPTTASPR